MIDAGIGANSASGGYEIDNSCKFEADNTEYLTQTPSSDSNRQKFTISLWVKRCELGSYQTLYGAQPSGGYSDANTFQFCFTPDDKLGLGLQTYWVFQTNRVFRDTSAWYHIVVRADTTQPFSHNRIRVYINGVQDTSFSTNALASIAEDQLLGVNHTTRQQIGSLIANSWHSSNYIADVNLIDGQSHAPSYFGEFDQDSGIWKAKEYTGTYGTNGFYLNFENSSDLGEDQSGNNNDWTLNNLTAADQSTDTPTNNFCTLNVIANLNALVYTEGGTVASTASGGNVKYHAEATMGFSSGKWYFEAYVTSGSTNDDAMFGFARPGLHKGTGDHGPGNDTVSIGAHQIGRWYYNNQSITTTGMSGWDKADIVQIAMDCDNGKAWQGVNGTYSSGNPSTNTGGFDWNSNVTDMAIGDLLIPVTRAMYTGPGTTYYNFGGYTKMSISSAASDSNGYGTFEYAPPTGFYALCTKNLAEYG